MNCRVAQQSVDAFRFIEAFIDTEAQVWGIFQVDATRDFRPQENLVVGQRLDHGLGVIAAERHHVNRGKLQVG